jgi:hypothetical protein
MFEFGSRIRNMRTNGSLRTLHVEGHLRGGHVFHIAQQEGHSFAGRENRETSVELRAVLSSKQHFFGTLERAVHFRKFRDIGHRISFIAPQKIYGSVARDPRKPMPGPIEILQLGLPLKGFNERLLGEILGIVHVIHDAINQHENAPEMLLNEARLGVGFGMNLGVGDGRQRLAHARLQNRTSGISGLVLQNQIRAASFPWHSPDKE